PPATPAIPYTTLFRSLEVGTASKPIPEKVTAEIIIADQKIDRQLDPAELGAGIESLGKITMHGAVKSPTFVRLAQEPLAGQTTLDRKSTRLNSSHLGI